MIKKTWIRLCICSSVLSELDCVLYFNSFVLSRLKASIRWNMNKLKVNIYYPSQLNRKLKMSVNATSWMQLTVRAKKYDILKVVHYLTDLKLLLCLYTCSLFSRLIKFLLKCAYVAHLLRRKKPFSRKNYQSAQTNFWELYLFSTPVRAIQAGVGNFSSFVWCSSLEWSSSSTSLKLFSVLQKC